jgi:GNAT superfamily N-acetyltransferase
MTRPSWPAELTVQPAAIEAGEVWVAEEAGEIVGLLELVPRPEEAEVRLIFVAPEHIGGGVGVALWRHMEKRALAHGAERIGLDADPNAAAFYERMGMRTIGESPSGSIPGRMLPRMRKVLAC